MLSKKKTQPDIRQFFASTANGKRTRDTNNESSSSTSPSSSSSSSSSKGEHPATAGRPRKSRRLSPQNGQRQSLTVLFALPHRNARKWKRVEAILARPIRSVNDFDAVFRDLHPQRRIRVRGFAKFVNEVLADDERTRLFSQVFPFIQKLLLDLPKVFNNEKLLPLLRGYNEGSVDLTRHQCACLLAASFFCVHEKRSSMKYQNPNFTSFFQNKSESQFGKFQCILHYFDRLRQEIHENGELEERMITFHRRVLTREQCNRFEPQNVENLGIDEKLTELKVRNEGTIEDDGIGMLQADFANAYIGGGVLNTGCVQEEIRFMINPECLVSLLLCDVMKSRESIVIIGAERFSDYDGYGQTFSWAGDHVDKTKKDPQGRLATVIVAIDAIQCYKTPQFKQKSMVRELAKAYVGFSVTEDILAQPYNTVATGNWGCGVFGGDVELKSLLQYCAISLCKRSTEYFTFGERETRHLELVVKVLRDKNVTINELWKLILDHQGRDLYRVVLDKYSPEDAKQLHLSFEALSSDSEQENDTEMENDTESESDHEMKGVEKTEEKSVKPVGKGEGKGKEEVENTVENNGKVCGKVNVDSSKMEVSES